MSRAAVGAPPCARTTYPRPFFSEFLEAFTQVECFYDTALHDVVAAVWMHLDAVTAAILTHDIPERVVHIFRRNG